MMFTLGVLQLVWPHMLLGCNINRKTDEMLRNAGKWESFELVEAEGQSRWDPIRFVQGRLIKARE
jgi:hypothetical protein